MLNWPAIHRAHYRRLWRKYHRAQLPENLLSTAPWEKLRQIKRWRVPRGMQKLYRIFRSPVFTEFTAFRLLEKVIDMYREFQCPEKFDMLRPKLTIHWRRNAHVLHLRPRQQPSVIVFRFESY